MDVNSIPERDLVPMDDIAEGVFGLRIVMVNVFAIQNSPSDWVLIDGGLRFSDIRIQHWAATHFGAVPPRAVILTHGHFDHVGALPALLEKWDVPVYTHRIEMPYVTGHAQYPGPDLTVGGGLMALLSPFYPRGPFDLNSHTQAMDDGVEAPFLPGWRVVHTPGHTDGHVSFFRGRDRCLIVGDAFCTTKAESATAIATQRPELHGPPAYYTSDWDRARDSVRALAALRPNVVAPGHGQPMAGREMLDALDQLARNFDQIARPESKRAA